MPHNLGLIIAFQDEKRAYLPGDTVRGTVVHHSIVPEPRATISIKFCGYAAVYNSRTLEVFSQVALFESEKVYRPDDDMTSMVKGTQYWNFEFVFPALSSPSPVWAMKPTLPGGLVSTSNRTVQNGARRCHISPSTAGEFSAKGSLQEYTIEYGIDAIMERPNFPITKSSRPIRLLSPLQIPGRITSLTIPQLREPLPQQFYHAVKRRNFDALKHVPRVQIHMDSFYAQGLPFAIRVSLADESSDVEQMGQSWRKEVRLRKIRVTISEEKKVFTLKTFSHEPELRGTSPKEWVFSSARFEDLTMTHQALELSKLMVTDFACAGISTTAQCPNISISHTISVAAEVSWRCLAYNVHLSQSLKVVHTPERQVPARRNTVAEPITPTAPKGAPEARQDSLQPFPDPGRQFPDLPTCHMPPAFTTSGKPPSAELEPDADGVIRRDWQNIHDMRRQIEAVVPKQKLRRETMVPIAIAWNEATDNGERAAQVEEQLSEAVEICRRRSSVMIGD